MKNSRKTLHIGFPAEAEIHNALKTLLAKGGLIDRRHLDKEVFRLDGTRVEFVTLTSEDATQLLLEKKVDSVIGSEDICSDVLLGSGMRVQAALQSAPSFSRFARERTGSGAFLSERHDERVMKDVLPANLHHPLTMVTPIGEKKEDLIDLARKGDIVTNTPFLTRRILAEKLGGNNVGRIHEVTGNPISLVSSGIAPSALVRRKWGDHLEKDGLQRGEMLFDARPVMIARDFRLRENADLRNAKDRIFLALGAIEDKRQRLDTILNRIEQSWIGRLGATIGR